MASFDDVSNGLEWCVAIRSGFRARNETASTPLAVRIGLAAGEPVDRDGDLFGPTVNLASRLCAGLTPTQSLCRTPYANRVPQTASPLPRLLDSRLKGFAAPVHAYRFRGKHRRDSEG